MEESESHSALLTPSGPSGFGNPGLGCKTNRQTCKEGGCRHLRWFLQLGPRQAGDSPAQGVGRTDLGAR